VLVVLARCLRGVCGGIPSHDAGLDEGAAEMVHVEIIRPSYLAAELMMCHCALCLVISLL
jgi:hypothetical protein